MTTISIIIIFLLFVSANAQGVQQETSSTSSAGLQPWLIGLTAMVVFLFIVFVLLIVNRVWCKKRKEADAEDNKEEGVTMNVYDNDAFDKERPEDKPKEHEGNKKAKWVQDENDEPNITAM
ncbi:hypothetical protein GDO81_001098 [Engystomops pustulosus]|uniref:Small integral membrane protein 24 n=1 Tax=Engystomops pustulosus TaxID=76066 RepID=A0AAV7D9P5_ENGPU|nr:hypothetical protein GDO81_001098 [Engystomops pustulosus]